MTARGTVRTAIVIIIGVGLFATPRGVLRAAGPSTSIPLCPGLTVVTAVSQPDGDYESIKTIESVSSADVGIKYSSERMDSDLASVGPPTLKHTTIHRTVLARDMQSATGYQQVFLEKSAETIPGTTAISASASTLKDLKGKGEADFSISSAYGGLELTADRETRPNFYDYLMPGKIRRVEPGTVPLTVLVNDTLVALPTIHAAGELGGDKTEFFVLDDENNPLMLRFRIGIGAIKPLDGDMRAFCETQRKNGVSLADLPLGYGAKCAHPDGGDKDTLQVVKITYRCAVADQPSGGGGAPGGGGAGGGGGAAQGNSAQGGEHIEQSLADTGRAVVYGIYFSFGSDAIREESEPVLKEIAEALGKHPAWKLNVEGHTDNIGSNPSNQDLSNRRSASVKKALVERYHIAPDRLSPSGFGASRPKATNDTLEGRALNRRVELVKQ